MFEENTEDLFDVFNGKAAMSLDDESEHTSYWSASKKRTIDISAKDEKPIVDAAAAEKIKAQTATIDAGDIPEQDNAGRLTSSKRVRRTVNLNPGPVADVKPVVADEFEQESSRQVEAAAGLQPTVAEGQLVLSHQVRHQVALPPDYPYIPISQHISPVTPVRTYPFALDPFQRVAIASIERNESVLVSAHTSAGKTVVAEYAIALSLRDKQRVIYTSPIKALSNQKYRELLADFGDVGLMTGDVTINPSASCLVMTTEILRSMLYRGSEIMREVAWVIFDEIHYMRDSERGVVWEETIILLPHKVHYVFLSATIPNAMEFAEWVCKTHEEPCHVVYTDFRPTPLQHYLFPAGGEGIHLVVDEKSIFREDNFQKAIGALTDSQGEDPASLRARAGKNGRVQKGKPKKDGPSDIYKIVKMIMMKNYHPVIIFSFSKRECEALALQMSKLDFNDDTERTMVAQVFNNAINSLSEDDKKLPQIEHILPLLKRGIGIHHGGLLPILKEIIEILFQEGLLKVLFATETFSIGLNMPARTVVFTSVRKYDGKDFRWVSSGEYIQMSGRAGRRGLDDRGIVIMMVDERMAPAIAKGMVKGQADPLNSAFHLKYSMILNLMRVEGVSPEYLLKRSFYQFQNNASIPNLEKEMQQLEADRDAIAVAEEVEVAEYYELRRQLETYAHDMREIINQPTYALPFLQPGRLAKVSVDDMDFGWGIIVSYSQRKDKKDRSRSNNEAEEEETDQTKRYIVDILLHVASSGSSEVGPLGVRPPADNDKGEMVVVPVLLYTLNGFSDIRMFLPKDLKSPEQRNSMLKLIKEVHRRFPDGLPVLDPIENMGIKDESFKKLVRKIEVLEDKLLSHPLHSAPDLAQRYEAYARKMKLGQELKALKKKISAAHSIMQLDELKCRKRVLRRLNFSNQSDVIEMKGRVACEISAGDELLLTELIFDGVFGSLTVEQCVALLSCFVFEEKVDPIQKPPEQLMGPLRKLQETARHIAKVSQESKIEIDVEEYVQKFRPELMEVVFAWCQGEKFARVCKMTEVFEGSLIRVFRRLEELLRQMAAAAKSIGNTELEIKFAEGITRIKRDIVFAASLYL